MDLWCLDKKTDRFPCSLKISLDFLTYLFGKAYQYRYINAHRSSSTAYHSPIKGTEVGKHSQTCVLMSMVLPRESHQLR